MEISKEIIKNEFEKHYGKELIITPKMLDILHPIIVKSYVSYEAFLKHFRKDQGIVNYIKESQPYIKDVPDNVVKIVKDYFKQNLANYTPISVCRYSNAIADNYLYMVIGKNKNGTYACWSSFNISTESLNFGHYDIELYEDCKNILKGVFYDITGEPDKYGIDATIRSVDNNSIQSEQNNIIKFKHKHGR